MDSCEKVRKERVRFYSELSSLSFLRVLPSQSNYFMCELIRDTFTSTELAERLISGYNILIKDCSAKKGINGKNYIRIALKKKEENKFLIRSLRAIYDKNGQTVKKLYINNINKSEL